MTRARPDFVHRLGCIFALGVLTGARPMLLAGQEANAKYLPLVVQLPVSVRAQGLGGAWTAGRDADAVFSNPANAGASGLIVGGARFGTASSVGHAATGLSFGATGVSLGVAWLDYGTTPGTQVPWSSLGQRGSEDGFSAVAVAAAMMTYKGIRWGAAAKILEERIANSHDGMAGFDVGAAKDFGRTSYGVAVQNLGGTLDVRAGKAYAPTRYSIGANSGGYAVGPFDLAGGLALNVRRDGFVAPAGGLEASYSWLEGYLVSVRVGASRPEAQAVNPLALGASFGLDRFIVDYAFADLRAPSRGAVHSVGIRVR